MSKKPKVGASGPANEQERAESKTVAPGRETPIITALALAFVPGKGWTSLVYHIQGEKILKVDASEPDLKVFAQEKFKGNMARCIISEDGRLLEIKR